MKTNQVRIGWKGVNGGRDPGHTEWLEDTPENRRLLSDKIKSDLHKHTHEAPETADRLEYRQFPEVTQPAIDAACHCYNVTPEEFMEMVEAAHGGGAYLHGIIVYDRPDEGMGDKSTLESVIRSDVYHYDGGIHDEKLEMSYCDPRSIVILND